MTHLDRHPRRAFLRHTAKLVMAGTLLPFARNAVARLPDARALSFSHTHTGENLSLTYAVGENYLPEALSALNHFLRDHYSGVVGSVDPNLFDLLFRLQRELGGSEPFQVISGYRSPRTNMTLRQTRGGGVAKHSLHMEGKAIDLRLPGVPLSDVRDVALSLREGGVGYYQTEQFVHIDTGRIRNW
jgi:uncharacterized protein YcbK (DUF882 family)